MGHLVSLLGPFFIIEFTLLIVVIGWAFLAPASGGRLFGLVERTSEPLLRNSVAQIFAVGVFALILRAIFLPWLGPPVPVGHDEHSLFLQAETFLAGRLSNPTHPLWVHFESIHINQVPTYSSMYFPGRGLPLLAGLLLAGNPWVGVWLSFVFMSMAAVWMLQGWLSSPYAFIGGMWVVIRLGLFSYWINSYWGGAFSALGAMLVVGAFPRALRSPTWSSGVTLGLGALILMTTRPFEGALLCLPFAAALLFRLVGWARRGWLAPAARLCIPVVCLTSIGAAALLEYNRATTGDPWKDPYTLNRETYATTPPFLIADEFESQQRGPPHFRAFYEEEGEDYARRAEPKAIAKGLAAKVVYTWNFFIGILWTPLFIAGLWVERRSPILLLSLSIFFTGYAFETWNFPHYASPIFPVFLIITLKGLAAIRRRGVAGMKPLITVSRALPAASLLSIMVPASSVISGWPSLPSNQSGLPCCALLQSSTRSKVMTRLQALPGKDLVVVQGTDFKSVHLEVVYNAADIDRADVVWAHRLSPAQDARLISYFSERNVWEFTWIREGDWYLVPLKLHQGNKTSQQVRDESN